jgi:hypothetical protein
MVTLLLCLCGFCAQCMWRAAHKALGASMVLTRRGPPPPPSPPLPPGSTSCCFIHFCVTTSTANSCRMGIKDSWLTSRLKRGAKGFTSYYNLLF